VSSKQGSQTERAYFDGLMSDAVSVLRTAKAVDKAQMALTAADRWWSRTYDRGSRPASPPDIPARPAEPVLGDPKDVPKRRLGSAEGRIALIHAVAHIELNAIDLAWDMIARFGDTAITQLNLGHGFLDDWVQVGEEEAKHFLYLNQRLEELGSYYGATMAHAGLWDAALATKDDLLARLSIVPMVLEARGLDVNPSMAKRLRSAGDGVTAEILDLIYQDEIGHVKIGTQWFHKICETRGLDAKTTFESNLRSYFKGQLKPPFNNEARELAGLPLSYYDPSEPKRPKAWDLN